MRQPNIITSATTIVNYRRVYEIEVFRQILRDASDELKTIDWLRVIAETNNDEQKSVLEARRQFDRVDDELNRWHEAIQQGVRYEKSVNRMLELEAQRRELTQKAALDRYIDPELHHARLAKEGLSLLQKAMSDTSQSLFGQMLGVLVDRVVMTPIASQSRGSTLRVTWKPHGWSRFVHLVAVLSKS